MSKKTRKYLHSQMALTKGGLLNSMIFRCSPLGLGVKQLKIIEFSTFRSRLKIIKFKALAENSEYHFQQRDFE